MNDMPLIERQMRIYAERRMAHMGLGFPEQRILMYLAANAPSNQDSMSSRFGIDKGSIAKSVSKLEAKGYVTRTVNPNNKREKLIDLTDAGRRVLGEMRAIFNDWEKAVYTGLTDEEVQQAQDLISKMSRNALAATASME